MTKIQLTTDYYTWPLSDEQWENIKKLIDSTGWEPNTGSGRVRHLIAAYDSETSNYTDKHGNKLPFAFSEMTTLMTEDNQLISVLTRKPEDFVKFIGKVAKLANTYLSYEPLTDSKGNVMYDDAGLIRFKTTANRYLNVYVHNLPFDVEFLLSKQKVYRLFAQSSHKPYYVIFKDGCKFIDTVVLTHKTLEMLGYDLQKYDVKKAVGDFDYKLIRTPLTPFTKKEQGYVINDTLVLASYMRETMDQFKGLLSNIPLTQTGIVRRYLRGCFNADPEIMAEILNAGLFPESMKGLVERYVSWANAPHAVKGPAYKDWKNKFDKMRDHVKDLMGPSGHEYKINLEVYEMMQRAYMGGFTHSNPSHTGKVMQDVQSWDFTSSYPTRILSKKFPASQPIKLNISSEEALKRVDECDNDDYIYLFDFEADVINSKVDYDFLWSSNKCSASVQDDSNGRVMYAENFKATMLSIDYDTFKQVYDVENPRITNIYMFRQEYLPLAMIIPTIHFYKSKTELKHVKGKEKIYTLRKQMVNSIYGLTVTSPLRDSIGYVNGKGYKTVKAEEDKQRKLEKYNQSPSRFLYYIWGICISSWSRHELWRGIMECKNDYIYSDTDSLKVINADKHKAFIDSYNKQIRGEIAKCLKFYGLDPKLAAPCDIKGTPHQIGEWDPLDGHYSYFKTLGAKRYAVIDSKTNEFEITVAGLSKSKGASYILMKTNVEHDGSVVLRPSRNYKKLFNFFDDDMYVPAEYTGKLAHFYVDHYDAFDVKDYLGNTYHVPAGSGTLLKPVDFSMNISKTFLSVLERYSQGGYIEDPNDHINSLD